MSRAGGLLVAVATVLVMVACASEPPAPVVIGSAPAAPTGPIDLSGPTDSSGFFAPDAWPRACDLLTDADLAAVLPQATAIARAGESRELTVFGNLQSDVYTAPSTITIPEATCVVRFSLPGLELDPDLPLTTTSTGYAITVGVLAAGSEEVVVANTEFGPAPVRTLGAAGCDDSEFSEIVCTASRMRFSVSVGGSRAQYSGDNGSVMRYEYGSQVSTFEGGQLALRAFEGDTVVVELASAVAAKLG